jgi:murein DD-endopeptidase MepM/ murein hydrolase activator NlpD
MPNYMRRDVFRILPYLYALICTLGLSEAAKAQTIEPNQTVDLFAFPLGSGSLPTWKNDKIDSWHGGYGICRKVTTRKGNTAYHLGEDWNYKNASEELSQPVRAAGAGLIVYAQEQPSSSGIDLGNVVVIKHRVNPDTYRYIYTLYAHLGEFESGIIPGVNVTRGQKLGTIGDSGLSPSDTPHLHFEVFQTNFNEALAEYGYASKESCNERLIADDIVVKTSGMVEHVQTPEQFPVSVNEIDFDNTADNLVANNLYAAEGVQFTRDDGADVYISEPPYETFSPPYMLATIGIPWSTHLNINIADDALWLGLYYGNHIDADAVSISVYDEDEKEIGSISMPNYGQSTNVTNFLGLGAGIPFVRARVEYVGSTNYAVAVDNLYFR